MTALAGQPAARQARSAAGRIALAGLAGGAVDFAYASGLAIFRGRSVEKVWQSVASGAIGKTASEGGWATAALGVAIHFAIATAMAGAYALAAARLPVLRRRPLAAGAIYGVGLYAVMYGLVLPVRFGRPYRWNGTVSVGDVLAHVAVGVTIAWVLSRPRKLTHTA